MHIDPLIALSLTDLDRIVEMAWEDRTPFEAIERQFGLTPAEVIVLMRKQMTAASFRRWRKRTSGRLTKHQQLRESTVLRFKCDRQRSISGNRLSKRQGAR